MTAYGESDALNAAIGSAAVACEDGMLSGILGELQKACFVLGADLATPPGAKQERHIHRIEASDVVELEQAIDAVEEANTHSIHLCCPADPSWHRVCIWRVSRPGDASEQWSALVQIIQRLSPAKPSSGSIGAAIFCSPWPEQPIGWRAWQIHHGRGHDRVIDMH